MPLHLNYKGVRRRWLGRSPSKSKGERHKDRNMQGKKKSRKPTEENSRKGRAQGFLVFRVADGRGHAIRDKAAPSSERHWGNGRKRKGYLYKKSFEKKCKGKERKGEKEPPSITRLRQSKKRLRRNVELRKGS